MGYMVIFVLPWLLARIHQLKGNRTVEVADCFLHMSEMPRASTPTDVSQIWVADEIMVEQLLSWQLDS